MNMKRPAFLTVLCGLLLACGCVENNAIVKVATDGSGTIKMRWLFSPKMVKKLTKSARDGLYNKADMITKARQLGRGVKFVRGKAVTAPSGWKGMIVEYSFSDVTKLRLQELSNQPLLGKINPRVRRSWHFEFDEGDPAVLRIVPDWQIDAAEGGADGGEDRVPADIKALVTGMRVALFVQVDGRITACNARYKMPGNANTIPLINLHVSRELDNYEVVAQLNRSRNKALVLDQLTAGEEPTPGVYFQDPTQIVEVQFK